MKARVKKWIETEPYYKRCFITGLTAEHGKIDMHHAFKYAGRKIYELIVPVLHRLHVDKLNGGSDNSVHNCKATLHLAQYEALRHWKEVHGDFTELQNKYPKKDWQKLYELLKAQYQSC